MTHKMTLVAALWIVGFSLSPVFAQGAGQQSRTPNPAVQNPVDSGEVTRLLQSGNLDDAAKATITTYMRNFFVRWTDQKNTADLGKYRKDIQTLVEGVSNPQGKSTLLGLLAKALYDIANDTNKKDYYPACRYNAVLTLGELDEGVAADGRPKPYLKALDALYQLYKNQGDGQDTTREAVRLGALHGIRRHVILGNIQTSNGQQIADLLISIAADTPYENKNGGSAGTGPNPPENVIIIATNPNALNTAEPQRTVELHNWFRNTAIGTLGYLSVAAGPTQNAIIDALLERINDEAELPVIRYQCAYSLSRFNKTIETSPDLLKKTTGALLTLGLVIHDDGIQTMLDEQSTQQTVGSMSGGMGGSMGGGMEGGMGMSPGGGMSGMYGGGTGSTMGQAQADQINNSLIQIKDGFSSMIACIQGPDYRTGGLVNSEAVKETPYHEVLTGLNKTITECVKFLDEGDPEAAKRAKQQQTSGMDSMGMSMGSGMGTSSTGATTTVKNQPKVTMKEIEDRLKIVKNDIERLKGIMNALDAGILASN
ncbi:MAG: hypothetical protein FWH27_13530 [Planctomycetaceae bacterium]|nr:hypothetical protein [Planctomycetaceae bacterium]